MSPGQQAVLQGIVTCSPMSCRHCHCHPHPLSLMPCTPSHAVLSQAMLSYSCCESNKFLWHQSGHHHVFLTAIAKGGPWASDWAWQNNEWRDDNGPLAKNQPEPVTGPWVYTETVYLFTFHPSPRSNPALRWPRISTVMESVFHITKLIY